MENSKSTTAAPYTPTHCPKSGRKFTKDERRANNKAKWLSEQAAKAKARKAAKPKGKSKPKSKPVSKQGIDRIPVEQVKQWIAAHPKRKTVSAVDITDWTATASNTKVGKRLANKGKIDSQMSKRNGKLEVQAQRKGGTVAA